MSLNFETKALIHNRFDIFKKNILTGIEKQVAQGWNVILDSVWATFNFSAYNTWIGTGTGTIDRSRTTMFSYLTKKVATEQPIDYSRYWTEGIVSRRRYITFIETEQVGQFFTEIGVGGSSNLCTHALICDMEGNPISIEKTDTDILTIYSTIYGYLDPALFNGNSYLFIPMDSFSARSDSRSTSGICDMLTGGGKISQGSIGWMERPNLGGKLTNASEYDYITDDTVILSYSSATKTLTMPARRISASKNTVNKLRYISMINYGNTDAKNYIICRILKHPSWIGSFIEQEVLGIGDGLVNDFVTDYGFIQSGAKIYFDGVEQLTGFTVDTDIPISNNIDDFMNIISQTTSQMFPGMRMSSLYETGREDTVIYENTKYLTYGIDTVSIYYGKLYCSNNLVDWTLLLTKNSTSTDNPIPSQYRNYRYWKFVHPDPSANAYTVVTNHISSDLTDIKLIHFTTPPGLITGEAVGTGDGTEVDFALDHIPNSGTLIVKVNNIETTDYTLVDAAITFNTPPGNGLAVTADYIYPCSITIDYTTKECVKNSNYVIDVGFTIQVGEYTGEAI